MGIMGLIPKWLRGGAEAEATPFVVEAPLLDTEPPGPDAEDVVVLENVHKTYLLGVEGVPALRGVTLRIKRGEFVTVLGTSGGGKTSLLNIIGTIDKPTKGDLNICGQPITWKTGDKILADTRLNRLGFVFQTFNLISSMSARENVELPMILSGRRDILSRRKRSKELLTNVGLGSRMKHFPSMMSGGEQQRVTIARALANDPDILLLDEPTGDLDTKNTEIVMRMITELNKNEGKTIIMVTHDVALKGFSHRTIHMRDGKVQREEIIPEEKRREKHIELYEALKARSLGPTETVSHPAEFRQTEIRHRTEYSHFGVRSAKLGPNGLVETKNGEGEGGEEVVSDTAPVRSYTRAEIEEIIRAGYLQMYSANVDQMQGGLPALMDGITRLMVGPEGGQPGAGTFSQALHEVVEAGGPVVGWDGGGAAIVIRDLGAFCRDVLPSKFGLDHEGFFRGLESAGFTRQSNLGEGDDAVVYAHPRFLRGRADLLPLESQPPPYGSGAIEPLPVSRHHPHPPPHGNAIEALPVRHDSTAAAYPPLPEGGPARVPLVLPPLPLNGAGLGAQAARPAGSGRRGLRLVADSDGLS